MKGWPEGIINRLNYIDMDMLKILNIVDEVRERLEAMDFEFGINLIETHDRQGNLALIVTWGESIFDKHLETLDKYWDTDLFMSYFEGRKHYLALPQEERAAIKMHPEVWEKMEIMRLQAAS